MAKVYTKTLIDYVETLGQLDIDDSVFIPTSDNIGIENIRAQVAKMRTKLPGMVFRVNKTINGATVTRVRPDISQN